MITDIYNNFRSNFENSSDYVIDFYSKNSLYFNNISTFSNIDELRQYIELVWQYLNAIFQKSRFSEVVDVFEGRISFIDREIERINGEKAKDEWYWGLHFFRGMALYRMHDYKAAKQTFQALYQQDPKNEINKNWLYHAKYGQHTWIIKIIWIIGGIALFAEVFFGKYLPNSKLRLMVTILVFTLLVSNGLYEFITKRGFQKRTKLNNN